MEALARHLMRSVPGCGGLDGAIAVRSSLDRIGTERERHGTAAAPRAP
jgi:hypothetical protein